MLLQEEREQVVLYGQRIFESGLTTGTGRNISVFNRDELLFAIKPSGMEYFDIAPEDVVVLNLNDEVVDGIGSFMREGRILMLSFILILLMLPHYLT